MSTRMCARRARGRGAAPAGEGFRLRKGRPARWRSTLSWNAVKGKARGEHKTLTGPRRGRQGRVRERRAGRSRDDDATAVLLGLGRGRRPAQPMPRLLARLCASQLLHPWRLVWGASGRCGRSGRAAQLRARCQWVGSWTAGPGRARPAAGTAAQQAHHAQQGVRRVRGSIRGSSLSSACWGAVPRTNLRQA